MRDPQFIVGDAGGTSTHWRVVRGDTIKPFKTIGYNAYTHNLDAFKKNIIEIFRDELGNNESVHLYAAGVDTKEQKNRIEAELKDIFGDHFTVENDLVGAARALCGKEPGNVCILGTGSNACYYNGSEVNTVTASLGYVLGDEGSGAYMGKKLLMGVFRDQFSQEIVQSFRESFQIDAHQVIRQIYHEPKPNHFLASFARFIDRHRDHPEIYRLVYTAFQDFYHAFFSRNKYAGEAFHFSGSIAFHFSDILRQVGKDTGSHIKNIIASPIAGLACYHQQYG